MPLFQTSVLKKYLSQQDQTAVQKAYRKYSKYFLNAEIQENIRSSKEEQFQATFLTELFVNVLDYSKHPCKYIFPKAVHWYIFVANKYRL